MRFAIVCPGFESVRGGVERHAHILRELVINKGHTATVISGRKLVAFDPGDFDWVFFEGVRRLALLRNKLRARRARTKVALFTHGSFYPQIHSEQLANLGYSGLSLRNSAKRIHDSCLLRPEIEEIDLLFTLSSAEQKDLVSFLRIRSSKVKVARNFLGSRGPPSSNSIPDQSWRAQQPYVCTVARLEPRKNLLAAITGLAGQPVNYLIAGQDGGELRRLKNYVERSAASNVKVLGEISEDLKNALLSNSVAFVLPSFFEGTPYAVFEALLAGKPVICTENSYLDDYPGLEKVRPDAASIRRAVNRLLESQPLNVRLKYPTDEEIFEELLASLGSLSQ